MMKKPSIRERALLAIAETPLPIAPGSIKGETALPPSSASHFAEPRPPKTGPGTTMMFMERQSSALKENQELRAELQQWSESLPVRKLATSSIVPSKWANRHVDSFSAADFVSLKTEIGAAGGNVQPIKVRPIPHSDPEQYEIVFGHRRHQACAELGLPVLSMIDSIDDKSLFVEMDRENRERADLRPYEQGEMYRRALDSGLYPSLRALAADIGLEPGNVSKAIQIARLPSDVLNAFPSPLDIQYRWATPLSTEASKDVQALIGVAKQIILSRAGGEKLSANAVFARLTGFDHPGKLMPVSRKIQIGGKEVARIKRTGSKVTLEISDLSKTQEKDLESLVKQLLS